MTVRIKAGFHDRRHAPLNIPLNGQGPDRPLWLVDGKGTRLPVQADRNGAGEGLVLLPEMSEGKSEAFRLETGAGAAARVECADDGEGRVDVTIDGEPFTTYNYLDVPKPYCYPVYGPGGENMVRNYPMREVEGETRDHPHHRGLYTAHGHRSGVDPWAEGDHTGKIVHKGLEVSSGPVCGEIRAQNCWVTASGHEILDEERTVTVYAVGGDARLLDYTLTLTAAHGDYLFEDTKEGGLIAWRVATWMDGKTGGHLVNAYGGRGQRETWGKRAPWCDYWADKPGGGRLGVAIFDHPGNFRYPTFWHIREYGLFTANPFGLADFGTGRQGWHPLPKGASITFRYRVFLHEGSTAEARVSERFHDFVNPPEVHVEA